jgi:hypothetical protein
MVKGMTTHYAATENGSPVCGVRKVQDGEGGKTGVTHDAKYVTGCRKCKADARYLAEIARLYPRQGR